jgi:hypothetical protein
MAVPELMAARPMMALIKDALSAKIVATRLDFKIAHKTREVPSRLQGV